jgi:hypothetical protein
MHRSTEEESRMSPGDPAEVFERRERFADQPPGVEGE